MEWDTLTEAFPFKNGDIVELIVDVNKQQISYRVNEKSHFIIKIPISHIREKLICKFN